MVYQIVRTDEQIAGNYARSGSWRKSSFSGGAGDCIEVAILSDARVGVRDSKASAGQHLRFPPDVWATFLLDVRATSDEDPLS